MMITFRFYYLRQGNFDNGKITEMKIFHLSGENNPKRFFSISWLHDSNKLGDGGSFSVSPDLVSFSEDDKQIS